MTPNSFMKKYGLAVIGAVVGAIGGFLYWRFVGCSSGSCPITSSPYMSTIWGAVIGGLLFDLFKKRKRSDNE